MNAALKVVLVVGVGYGLYRLLRSQTGALPVVSYAPLIGTPGATGAALVATPSPISDADLQRLQLMGQGWTQLSDGSMLPPGGLT